MATASLTALEGGGDICGIRHPCCTGLSARRARAYHPTAAMLLSPFVAAALCLSTYVAGSGGAVPRLSFLTTS